MDLFKRYVAVLYDILASKATETQNPLYLSKKRTIAKNKLLSLYSAMVDGLPKGYWVNSRGGSFWRSTTLEEKQPYFIQAIIKTAKDEFQVDISYRPEQKGLETLDEFINEHQELKKIIRDRKALDEALKNINGELNRDVTSPYRPAT